MKLLILFACALTAFGAFEADAPLLPDGTVSFGPAPGEDGVWELSYVENMADHVVSSSSKPSVAGRIRQRSAAAEPHVPFMPWSAAVYDYNVRTEAKYDPEGYCLPPGGPRLFTTPYPMTIIQVPEQKRIFFVFEANHVWREIYMDGRQHPAAQHGTWLGHSVGRYEDGGKTLVIDITGFNEGTWLDFAGHPHSDLLHVVEKFTRPTKNQLHYEAWIDDPGAYTRPWTVSWNMKWWPGGRLDEYICQENNKYIEDLKDDFGAPPVFRFDWGTRRAFNQKRAVGDRPYSSHGLLCSLISSDTASLAASPALSPP
jgi:hypothetical protein